MEDKEGRQKEKKDSFFLKEMRKIKE